MRWFEQLNNLVGPATVAAGVVNAGVTALSFAYTDTGPFVAAGGATLVLCVGLFEDMNRRIRRLSEAVESMSQLAADGLPPPLGALARNLDHQTRASIGLLRRPPNEYHSDSEFFFEAGRRLDRLQRGDEVIVVCADSPDQWRTRAVRRWLNQNFDASKRGVRITRILVTPDDALMQHAREQVAEGIRVVFVSGDDAKDAQTQLDVAPNVGIAVVNGTDVYWHHGTGRQFRGAFVESPLLAASVLGLLSTLSRRGEEVA